MSQIWKFHLPGDYRTICKIGMPGGAKILSVQLQNNSPTIWALVDPTNTAEYRIFSCIMTGQAILNSNPTVQRVFLATLQKSNGIVIHIFEILK